MQLSLLPAGLEQHVLFLRVQLFKTAEAVNLATVFAETAITWSRLMEDTPLLVSGLKNCLEFLPSVPGTNRTQ